LLNSEGASVLLITLLVEYPKGTDPAAWLEAAWCIDQARQANEAFQLNQ